MTAGVDWEDMHPSAFPTPRDAGHTPPELPHPPPVPEHRPETWWCAECLYDLRGRNASIQAYPSDEAMFAALETNDTVRGPVGHTLTPLAVTMWQGTPVCMDHLRMRWKP